MNAPTGYFPQLGFRYCSPGAPASTSMGVLITGGARRIGYAIARDLARTGCRVAIHYNGSEAKARALQSEIQDSGGIAATIQGDLSEAVQVETLLPRACELIGPINVLINNASLFEWDNIQSASDETWSQHMDLNLRAPLFLCQSFANNLGTGEAGVIINMLDSRVLNPKPKYLSYTLSKTALTTFTRLMARELAPRIRVNGIGPGPTLPHHNQTQEEFEQRCERLPLQRPASLSDICDAVHFFLNVQSVTGQMLALDGGDHLLS